VIFHATRPWNSLVVRFALLAVVDWGFIGVLGEHASAGIAGALGALIAMEWSRRQEFGGWSEQRRIAIAVRENRDPGPTFRGEVDSRAHWLVAHHRRAVWGITGFLGGMAAVFLAAAFLRGSSAPVWPALALLLCLPVAVLIQWRAVALAALWLANAPEPSEATPA
jgi:hypothetical protein